MPNLQAPVVPPHRIPELRDIATESRWHKGCPEPRCRERGGCAGKLRRFGEGPRCYPGCVHLVLGMALDPDRAGPAEARALETLLTHDAKFWASYGLPEDLALEDPAPSATMIGVLMLAAEIDATDREREAARDARRDARRDAAREAGD